MAISPFTVIALVGAAVVTPYLLIPAVLIEVVAAGGRVNARQQQP